MLKKALIAARNGIILVYKQCLSVAVLEKFQMKNFSLALLKIGLR